MIELSRSPRRHTGGRVRAHRAGAVTHALYALRHGLCFVAVSGCFYLKPPLEVDVNELPVILAPTEDPARVVLNAPTAVFSLIASDADSDTVFCEWPDLDNLAATIDRTPAGDNVWLCRAEVSDPSKLTNGQVVRAFVFDGDDDAVVTVRWQVERP